MPSAQRCTEATPKSIGAYLTVSLVVAAAVIVLGLQSGRATATTILFSDGFETGDLTHWSRVTVAGDATASVQSSIVRTGAHAARLSSIVNPSARAFSQKNLQPERTDVRADGAFNVQAEGASGGNVPFLRVFDSSGNRLLSLYRQNGNGGLWLKHSGAYYSTNQLIALGTWYDIGLRAVVGPARGHG